VVPAVLLPRLGLPGRGLARASLEGYALGGAVAVVVWSATEVLGLDSFIRATAVALATVALAVPLSRLLIERPGSFRRLVAIARDGGWRLLLRERNERIAARPVLAAVRQELPELWLREPDPLVTVRIATYNRGRLVADRAIASALAQTHRHLEVVVIGDACDAATEAAVRAVRDPRVRFENLPVRGAYPDEPYRRWMVAGAAPMNRGLEIARGSWIAPLDDDDEFTVDHVEVLLDACRRQQAELAYGIADMEVSPDRWVPVGAWPPAPSRIVHAAVLYNARLRIFPHALDSWRLAEPADWNMWKRMRAAGVRMTFVERIVCRHYLERREARRT
jgi:hypothetical protein